MVSLGELRQKARKAKINRGFEKIADSRQRKIKELKKEIKGSRKPLFKRTKDKKSPDRMNVRESFRSISVKRRNQRKSYRKKRTQQREQNPRFASFGQEMQYNDYPNAFSTNKHEKDIDDLMRVF